MRNLRNIRTFLCGMLATALLMGLVGPAVAASHVNKQLYYNDIKVRLNGKVLDLKDAKGKKVEPFIIDGTTYLPVRAVGEALDLNVSWDGATQTVVLGNDPVKGQPAAWLGELEPFAGTAAERKIERDGQYDDKFTANNGDTFDRYYYPNKATGTTYLLRGQYAQFTATLYLSKYFKDNDYLHRVQIFLDDKLAYTSDYVGSGIEPVALNVPLNGAYKMEIVTQAGFQMDDGSIDWKNSDYRGDSVSYGPWGTPRYFKGQLGNAALWTN